MGAGYGLVWTPYYQRMHFLYTSPGSSISSLAMSCKLSARLCGIPLTRGSLRPRYPAVLVMADRWSGANEPTPSGGTREANPTIKSLGTKR